MAQDEAVTDLKCCLQRKRQLDTVDTGDVGLQRECVPRPSPAYSFRFPRCDVALALGYLLFLRDWWQSGLLDRGVMR